MRLNDIYRPNTQEIERAAKVYGYKPMDLSETDEDTKEEIRNRNNDAFASILNHFGAIYKRRPVKQIINDERVPDYETGVVIKDKHCNYHRSGFTCGIDGKDKIFDVDIVTAFKYITG